MEWQEFLNDFALESETNVNPPNGKLLFKKLIHDILECLNGHKECIRLVGIRKNDIPDKTLNWLVSWEALIDIWIKEIGSLYKQFEDIPDDSSEWPNLIGKLGTILTNVPEMRKGVEVLVLSSEEKLRLVIQIAIRLTSKLNLIWHDIQAKEYKRLWTIRKYGNLVE